MTVLSSCGGTPDVGGIIEKYNAGEELTESDYSTLLDYMDVALSEVLPLAKEAQEAEESGDEDKIKELEEKGLELEAKYEHVETIDQIFTSASEEDLGEANTKKLQELMQKSISAFL